MHQLSFTKKECLALEKVLFYAFANYVEVGCNVLLGEKIDYNQNPEFQYSDGKLYKEDLDIVERASTRDINGFTKQTDPLECDDTVIHTLIRIITKHNAKFPVGSESYDAEEHSTLIALQKRLEADL